MKSLSIDELHAIFKNPSPKKAIVDVRTDEEFAEGHVPGSLHIPFDEIAQHENTLRGFEEIAIYCRSGGRAMKACHALEGLGFKDLLCVDDGGFPEWKAKGFTFE